MTGLSCFPRQEPRKYTGQRSRFLGLCRIYHVGCSNSREKVGVCRCQELRLKQTDFFDTSFEAGRREVHSLFQRDDLPAALLILHHGNNIVVKAQAAPMDDESVDSKFNDQTPGIRNRGGGVKSTLNRKTYGPQERRNRGNSSHPVDVAEIKRSSRGFIRRTALRR